VNIIPMSGSLAINKFGRYDTRALRACKQAEPYSA
jgi:hypothetical protein